MPIESIDPSTFANSLARLTSRLHREGHLSLLDAEILDEAVRRVSLSAQPPCREEVLSELEKTAEGWILDAWNRWAKNRDAESEAQLKGFQANAVLMAVNQLRKSRV